jgi:hypothetical protein
MLINNPFHKIQSKSNTKKHKTVTEICEFAEKATKENFAEFMHILVTHKKYGREYNHGKIEEEDIKFLERELRNCSMQYLNGCCLVRNLNSKDIGIVYDVSYSVNNPKKEVGGLLFKRPNGNLYKVAIHVAVAIRDDIYTTWSVGDDNIEILDDTYFSDYLRQHR